MLTTTLTITLPPITYLVTLRCGEIVKVEWEGHDVARLLPKREMEAIRKKVEEGNSEDMDTPR